MRHSAIRSSVFGVIRLVGPMLVSCQRNGSFATLILLRSEVWLTPKSSIFSYLFEFGLQMITAPSLIVLGGTKHLFCMISPFLIIPGSYDPGPMTMRTISRCVGACQLLKCKGRLTGSHPSISQNPDPLICRLDRCLISDHALDEKGSKESQDDRVGMLKSVRGCL